MDDARHPGNEPSLIGLADALAHFYHRSLANQIPEPLVHASYLQLQIVLTVDHDHLPRVVEWPPPPPHPSIAPSEEL